MSDNAFFTQTFHLPPDFLLSVATTKKNREFHCPAGPALSAMARSITVLLVDDHALVRRRFRRLLEDDKDITVVGEAECICI